MVVLTVDPTATFLLIESCQSEADRYQKRPKSPDGPALLTTRRRGRSRTGRGERRLFNVRSAEGEGASYPSRNRSLPSGHPGEIDATAHFPCHHPPTHDKYSL